MNSNIFDEPCLAEAAPIKRAKKKFLSLLKDEWKKTYKITPVEAFDLATIWMATPPKERSRLCRELSVRPTKKLDGFLKQFRSSRQARKAIRLSPSELLELANRLTGLDEARQLTEIWKLPSRKSLVSSLDLTNQNTDLKQIVISLLQYRNFSELSSLSEI